MGLQNGVERITKIMMSFLLIILIVLCIRSVTLPGASAGLQFYLIPDFGKIVENGHGEVHLAAMGPGLLYFKPRYRRHGHLGAISAVTAP